MKTLRSAFYFVLLIPIIATGQVKGYRTIQKMRYALADSVDKGKGRYYPLAPIGFWADSTVTDVYTNGDVFLHDLVYRFTSTVNDIPLVSEDRHHYLVFSKDSSYGYDWNGYNESLSIIQRIKIDSLLGKPWKSGSISSYEDQISKGTQILVSSKKNPESGILTEVYSVGAKSDTCLQTMAYFNYSRDEHNGIPAPARLPGMYITDIVMIAECIPCKFEMRFDLRPIDKIKEPIAQIFQAYLDNRLEIFSSGILIIGVK